MFKRLAAPLLLACTLSLTAAGARRELAPLCAALLQNIVEEMELRTFDSSALHADRRDWTLGAISATVEPAQAAACIAPDAIPESLGQFPRRELRALIAELAEVGGGVYVRAPEGGADRTDGCFGFGAGNRPLIGLAGGRRFPPGRALEILWHERGHFRLWREFRDSLVADGDTPEVAAETAREVVSSPLATLFGESRAVVAGLRAYGRASPVATPLGFVILGNYPFLQALLHTLDLQAALAPAQFEGVAPLKERLREQLVLYPRLVVERTARSRAILAQHFLERATRLFTEEQLRALLAETVRRHGSSVSPSALSPSLRDYATALSLRLAPRSLGDYFGVTLDGVEVPHRRALQSIFFPR